MYLPKGGPIVVNGLTIKLINDNHIKEDTKKNINKITF